MLITFEGTEGCGKSTLIRNLSRNLEALRIPHIVTREPGGSIVAEQIRYLILHHEMAPLTELFLYEAARAEHFHKTVLPALEDGKWVLCDRFTDSTLAYQGFARGLDIGMIEKLNLMATGRRKPDLTFFLDLPVEEGLSRAQDPNKFEKAGISFQKKVRKGFLHSIRKNRNRFRILKVKNRSPDQVCEAALRVLRNFL
ncbi:MAG: dTMP kinase [Bdellovibrionales bacterium]|nr:dTMP kinase [Bdellovibrionales bacterium]